MYYSLGFAFLDQKYFKSYANKLRDFYSSLFYHFFHSQTHRLLLRCNTKPKTIVWFKTVSLFLLFIAVNDFKRTE